MHENQPVGVRAHDSLTPGEERAAARTLEDVRRHGRAALHQHPDVLAQILERTPYKYALTLFALDHGRQDRKSTTATFAATMRRYRGGERDAFTSDDSPFNPSSHGLQELAENYRNHPVTAAPVRSPTPYDGRPLRDAYGPYHAAGSQLLAGVSLYLHGLALNAAKNYRNHTPVLTAAGDLYTWLYLHIRTHHFDRFDASTRFITYLRSFIPQELRRYAPLILTEAGLFQNPERRSRPRPFIKPPSLDDPDLEYQLAAGAAAPADQEHAYERREEAAALHRALRQLTPREATVLKARHGIKPYRRAHTLKEIGTLLALTRERIRQIERHALDHLEEHLPARLARR